MTRANVWFLPLLFFGVLLRPLQSAHAEGMEVTYDRERDLLSVRADQVPLTQVLGRISDRSGIEILIDPSIDNKISIVISEQPLEKALKQIARGLSYVMLYGKSSNQDRSSGLRLATMKLLPEGRQNSPNLVPVAVLNARAGRSVGGEGNRGTRGGHGGPVSPPGRHPEASHTSNNSAYSRRRTSSPEGVWAKDMMSAPQNNDDRAKQLREKTDSEPEADTNTDQNAVNDAKGGETDDTM